MTRPLSIDGMRIFEEAHKVHAAEVAKAHRVKLSPRGRYQRGQCPICDDSNGSEAFQAEDKGPLWFCHRHGEGGDAIKLEMLLGKHADRVAAARVLAGVADRVLSDRQRVHVEPSGQDRHFGELVESHVVASHIRRTSVPAEGEIVEAWLTTRGLDPRGIPGALHRLRFHPRCPLTPWRVGQDPEGGRTAPAMVALLDRVDPTGRSPAGGRILQAAGVHVTYLRPDGRAKAQFRRRDGSEMPARKMWGSVRGAGFWLTPVNGDDGDPLIVGEGIETVWSFLQRYGRPARGCAALSLRNIEGGWRADDRGALPLWKPIADPEKPPMLVTNPGAVIALIDADMKPVRVPNAQLVRAGRRGEVILSSLDRAQLCATLARQHWRGAGATSFQAMRPPIGMDFNDALIAEAVFDD